MVSHIEKKKEITNFQIQYFSVQKREEFKQWAHQNEMSMNKFLLLLIEKKSNIQKIIKEQ